MITQETLSCLHNSYTSLAMLLDIKRPTWKVSHDKGEKNIAIHMLPLHGTGLN